MRFAVAQMERGRAVQTFCTRTHTRTLQLSVDAAAAAASLDGMATGMEPTTGGVLFTIPFAEGAKSLAYSPSGTHLAVGCHDG